MDKKKNQTQEPWISRFNSKLGRAVSWLVLALILELVYDTTARYLFNAPTRWSYDISYMLYGIIFMLGAAQTLKNNKHVRIDLFLEKFSPRVRAALELAGYILFFFPAMSTLTFYGARFAYLSWQLKESSGASMWSPPIYPFKAIIPATGLLLLLQGAMQCLTLGKQILKQDQRGTKTDSNII